MREKNQSKSQSWVKTSKTNDTGMPNFIPDWLLVVYKADHRCQVVRKLSTAPAGKSQTPCNKPDLLLQPLTDWSCEILIKS